MSLSALTIGLAIYKNIPSSAKKIYSGVASQEIRRVLSPLGYLKFSAWKDDQETVLLDHYLVIQGNDFINRDVSVSWNDVVVRYDDKEGIIYSDEFYDLLGLKEKGVLAYDVNHHINRMVTKLVEQHRKGVRVFNLHKMFQEELEVFNA